MQQTTELALLPEEAANPDLIAERALRALGYAAKDFEALKPYTVRPLRRSIDARGRQILIRLQVEVWFGEQPVQDHRPIVSTFPALQEKAPRVLIVGAGPAGYFAALKLLEQGLKPIILERGKDVRARRRDLRAIQQDGLVNPHSNYCFGEGGAGTYSDGKLYTRSHKRGNIEQILQIFVDHGASADILMDAHPHIGSNKLPQIVQALRESIERLGGEVHFDAYVTDFILDEQRLVGVQTADGRDWLAEAVILATGHSARDIFELLARKSILIEAKPFALGARIEHPQALIDELQYHQKPRNPLLPASSYSLVCQSKGRGVFSFCMCPGGLIVPAATAPGELVVNGMSMSRRDSAYANSGMVVAVELEDLPQYPGLHPALQAMAFQAEVEQVLFRFGDGSQKAPAQRITDFVKGKVSSTLPSTSYIPGVYTAPLHELFPSFISERLRLALLEFAKKKKGYFTEEAQLVGAESRTSSPVRIPRDKETYMHPQIQGLFPCGEGAGYAGGIVSAAMDGQNVANKVCAMIKG
jgi:uncharacterized FAD-dependent dehydrogenase